MNKETYEMIIEELTSALSLERWKFKNAEAEISELKKANVELKKERERGEI